MDKVTWKAILKPGMKDEYIRRHNTIWPEMLQLLREAGIYNYTIWRAGEELFGYYECGDITQALRIQAESEVCQRWEKSMGYLIEKVAGPGVAEMEQVFSLE